MPAAYSFSKNAEAAGSTANIDTLDKGSDLFCPRDMRAVKDKDRLERECYLFAKENDFHDIKMPKESSTVATPKVCTISSIRQDPGNSLGSKHNDHVSPPLCSEGTGEKALKDLGGDCTTQGARVHGDDACSAISSSLCPNDLIYFDKLTGFGDQSPCEQKDLEIGGGMSECDEVLSCKESPQSSALQHSDSIFPSASFSGVGSSKRRPVASEDDTMTLKVKFQDNTARFKLRLNSSLQELKQEVEKRFKLQTDCFDMKFLDDEAEWMLLSCDADMIECIDIFKSTGGHYMKLMVQELQVTNHEKSCTGNTKTSM